MPSPQYVAVNVAIQGLLSETPFLRVLGEALKRQNRNEIGERDQELAKVIMMEYPSWYCSSDELFKNLRSHLDIANYVCKHDKSVNCCNNGRFLKR